MIPSGRDELSQNATQDSYRDACDLNIAELFLRQARVTPHAVAVSSHEATVSYAELAARVRQVDELLRHHGVGPEQPIGVLMRRSAELIAVLLGVMHAGAAYVPLDPDDPPIRNRRILSGSNCCLVLGDRASIAAMRGLLAEQMGEKAITFIEVEDINVAIPLEPSVATICAPGGRRLAYILFTSGSTGTPKGVEIEHLSVVNLLFAARDLIRFGPGDRYLAASTIGFDISVAEIFLPLITGGSLLLRDRKIWMNPRQLAEDVRTMGVTVLQTGPSVWSILLSEVPDFPRLRVAISTGEPVAPVLARKVAAAADEAWNLYGPTETTVWSTAHRLLPAQSPHETARAISAPIGRPIANTTVAIVDPSGTCVAAGERGELCIGGIGLARGYCGDDALTRERFVVLGNPPERVYRTGDFVGWNRDGDLEYFGRNDDQLKIRSVRIEPREIEAVILDHPAVAQVAATWFDGAGSRSIVAAIVPRSEQKLTAEGMYEWLASRLPAAMIPSRFIFYSVLPLAPSGKVDRNAIRESLSTLDKSNGDKVDATEPPLTDIEAVLVQIWQRLLKVKTVGLDDHFFSIGGDSLAAVRMITEVESIFKISLPVQTAFEAPSPRRLASRVEKANENSPTGYQSKYLFPLAEIAGTRPVFFSNGDLRLAVRNAWTPPCSLYSISHWTQGSGFMKADSVEELARSHLPHLQKIQPAGPYRIAGFCFGGLVALELARQLQEQGHVVELLVLLDPMTPFRTISSPSGHASQTTLKPLDEPWRKRISRHAQNLQRQPRGILSYCWERIVWHFRKNPLRQWLIFKLVHLDGVHRNSLLHLIVPKDRWPAFWYTARRMAVRYIARPHIGSTIAIFPDRGQRYQAWEELLDPQAELCFVPIDHQAFFLEANLSRWMNPLRRAILAADARAAAPSDSTAPATANAKS